MPTTSMRRVTPGHYVRTDRGLHIREGVNGVPGWTVHDDGGELVPAPDGSTRYSRKMDALAAHGLAQLSGT